MAYFKTKTKLLNNVDSMIVEAEKAYKDITAAGDDKFNYCVEAIYKLVPAFFKPAFTKKAIGQLVQAAFHKIANYATIQLDKAVEKLSKYN